MISMDKNIGLIELDCVITSGFGEGAFFISMQDYKKQIKSKLGFEAYSGTLNLIINQQGILWNKLKSMKQIKINGFKSGHKYCGGVDLYQAKIAKIGESRIIVNGFIIIPELNKHKNIIEFIAHVHLKSELKAKDGDKVKIIL